MFVHPLMATLVTIGKRYKQPSCPTSDEWVNKIWYKHTACYYPALTRKKILMNATRINLEDTVVHLLSQVWLFAARWTTACQASLTFTISRSFLKLWSLELVMPSYHLILCHPFFFAFSLSQYQGLFQRVGSSHLMSKVLELQLQHSLPSELPG